MNDLIKSLQKKSYADLKKLAKEHGIKPTQKKDILIEELHAKLTGTAKVDSPPVEEVPEVVLEDIQEQVSEVMAEVFDIDSLPQGSMEYIPPAAIQHGIEIVEKERIEKEKRESNKMPKYKFAELINEAIAKKLPKKIDFEKIYIDYMGSECGDSDNEVVNFVIKRIL